MIIHDIGIYPFFFTQYKTITLPRVYTCVSI